MTENEALIALNMMPGIGAVTVLRMRALFGSAAAVFEMDEGELSSVQGVGSVRAATLFEELSRVPYKEEIERADKSRITLVTLDDEDYPELLREISDPPLAL
jgi:DNA processing protein